MSLAGRVAVITGCASGIGAAVARVFADQGAAVVIGDLDPETEKVAANAGIPEQKGPVREMDLSVWQRVIDIDLTEVALCNKYAVTQMLRTGCGSVINMASILAHVGHANSTAYSATKAGVVNFTRSTALTYEQQNIRFNCFSPGYVNTPLLKQLPEATRAKMIDRMPIGRLLEPEEIANVVSFLASDIASAVTGAAINADGGYTAI